MFLLFVLSALVPVSVLSLMTYQQISVLIDKQSSQFLHQSSKAIGLRLFEKLEELTEVMNRHTSKITGKTSVSAFQEKINRDEQMRELFVSASLHDNNQTTSLFGDSSLFPSISISDHNRLNNGGYILVSKSNEQEQNNFYMIKKISTTNQILATRINPSFLWDISHFLPSDTEVCILDHLYKVLFCTHQVKLVNSLTPALLSAAQTHSSFSWSYNQIEYTAYVRPLFLKGAFHSPDWTIVLSTPKAQVVKPLRRFQNLFPPLIGLSILLVALFSSHQIRKSLVPLEKLKLGTQDISEGKFDTSVAINSGDEFEELAHSFNDMAKKLDTQFKSLQIVAEIDRIMLSSLDANYIIETVVDRIKDITEADSSLIYKIRQNESQQISTANSEKSVFSATISVNQSDKQLLNSHPRYIFIKAGSHIPDFLQDIVFEGGKSFVLLPIFLKDALFATVSITYNKTIEFENYDFQHARELADRIAVALTNADWEEKVYRQTNFDSITGLPNRKLLTDRLEQAMQRARRDNTKIAILLVDLDRFKAINDSLGQSSGDLILKEISSRFNRCIRETDSLVRFGGDEFVVIMSDIPDSSNVVNAINQLAKSLLNAVLLPYKISGHELNITASLGISLFPTDSCIAGDLLKFAESAMYHAKSIGKGGYHYYSKDMDATTLSQLVLESDLRHAFQKDELELYYQPQFELETKRIVCAEALVRWNHPKLGLLTPNKFLPLAVNTGLTIPLGDWIIKKAITQIRIWSEQNVPAPRIAINISAHHFNTDNLVDKIHHCITENKIRVDQLELEITEDTIMRNLDNTFNILSELKLLGIKLAIDDFGTGYSSLSYLTKFPIDYLKIDQSFIQGLPHDHSVSSIVSATIAMAHSLKLKVIAEGVENKKQLEYLRSRKCDIAQGYLLSKPITAEKLAELILSQHKSDRAANS